MSAYMCSERQLTILAAYAVKHAQHALPYEVRHEVDGTYELKHGGYDRTVGRVFSMLAAENLASLAYRYPTDSATPVDAYAPKDAARKETLPALHVIKLCHNYAYQACEHPGWQASDARKVIDAIEAHAVMHLPGYDDAPWGL